MAHRSQSSSIGDNPHDPNYLPPHYREEYRLAIDALIENDTQVTILTVFNAYVGFIHRFYMLLECLHAFLPHQGYYEFLQMADVVSFLAQPEIEFIKNTIQMPNLSSSMPELTYHDMGQEADGSSDTYWPVQSDLAAPGLDLGWPQHSFIGRTEVTTLVNPSEPDMPSIKEQARRLIKTACQVSKTSEQRVYANRLEQRVHWALISHHFFLGLLSWSGHCRGNGHIHRY